MAAGDLTATFIGRSSMSGGNIAATITGQNLAATTDTIQIVTAANGQEVLIFKILRAAA